MPYTRGRADDLPLVLMVIHDSTDAQTDDRERRKFFRCTEICLGEWVEVFRVRHGGFKLAPSYLKRNHSAREGCRTVE